MLEKLRIAEQVASHLRGELMRQRWTGTMPGRDKLARDLGVHGSTVERALQQMEKEGLVKKEGPGKPRRIVQGKRVSPGKQVHIVLYEPEDEFNSYIVELRRQLHTAGHLVSIASKTLRDLKHDPGRVAAMIKSSPANAHIVQAASRPVLEHLSQTRLPVFALFGRMGGLPIAGTGPDKLPALREAIDTLYRGGHRSIVLLSREERRENLGTIESVFFEELEKRGIPHSAYNLPTWDISPEGLSKCLDSLFRFTPPTSILVDDWVLLYAIQNYLLRKRGLAYRSLVCVCTDFHPSFQWCRPRIAHFYWDPVTVVQCAVAWLKNVGRGKNTVAQKLIKAEFRGREVLTKLG